MIIIFSCIISLVWALKWEMILPLFVQFLGLVILTTTNHHVPASTAPLPCWWPSHKEQHCLDSPLLTVRTVPSSITSTVILPFALHFVVQAAAVLSALSLPLTCLSHCFSTQPLQPHVRVWDSVSLATLQVIGLGTFERGVGCLDFSKAVR